MTLITPTTQFPVYRDHLRSLDGVRGIAVLMVLWAHCVPLADAVARRIGVSFAFGYLGVEIFFVLSGFLITRILLWDRAHDVPLRYFLARRALRIFPIYYLTLAIVWVFWRDPLTGWAAVYLSNYHLALYPAHGLLSPTWSLAVEEHFYMVWPLLVVFLPREKSRLVAQFGFLAIAVGTALMFTLFVENWRLMDRLIFQGSACRMISLGAGAALAYHERTLRSLRLRGVLLALAIVGVGGLVTQIAPKLVTIRWVPLIKLVAFPTFAAGMLVLIIRFSQANALPMRALRSRPLTYIGRISYGIYLYHFPIFVLLGITASREWEKAPQWKGWLALALTFGMASASYYLIEAPILRLKDRFAVKPRIAPPSRPPRVVVEDVLPVSA